MSEKLLIALYFIAILGLGEVGFSIERGGFEPVCAALRRFCVKTGNRR
ncbi:hypothetical protein [Lentibacter sp. XHP0401]|jgi:hypothetical protein|nr:hypothetical protein [Lentibacter sp. XHP0401]